ncbi:MAG: MBL fold metallo-hydrolase [Acidobacteriota bacterium]
MFRIEVLGSGSKGNCTFLQLGSTRLLIDAGLSRKQTKQRLELLGENPDRIDAVLLTHVHGDHVRGVPVLVRRHRIPVACHPWLQPVLGFKEDDDPEFIDLLPGRALTIGDVVVHPFRVPHDAEPTMGFRLEAPGFTCGYATDLGHVNDLVVERLSGLDALVIESNHDLDMLRDGDYPWSLKQRVGGRHGHLSNDSCAMLVEAVLWDGLRSIALAHLSEQNNDPALARAATAAVLRRRRREDIRLTVAGQDQIETAHPASQTSAPASTEEILR